MSLFDARPGLRRVLLPIGLLTLPVVLFCSANWIATNLLWLAVSRQLAAQETQALPSQVLMEWASTTSRGSQAVGILAALRDDETTAQSAWARAGDREQLLAIGLNVQRRGERDLALLFFRGAGDEPYTPGWFAIGHICQRTLSRPERLQPANQARCAALFQANGNNLILNGDWREGTLDGWLYLGALPEIERLGGPYDPTATLIGHNRERRSIYQAITLPPDTVVRFSALVRREGPLPARLSLLQVTFTQPNGSSAGNALDGVELLATPSEWRAVERTYRTREAQGNLFRFTPVLIEGEGRVQVDQVHLEIITGS